MYVDIHQLPTNVIGNRPHPLKTPTIIRLQAYVTNHHLPETDHQDLPALLTEQDNQVADKDCA